MSEGRESSEKTLCPRLFPIFSSDTGGVKKASWSISTQDKEAPGRRGLGSGNDLPGKDLSQECRQIGPGGSEMGGVGVPFPF